MKKVLLNVAAVALAVALLSGLAAWYYLAGPGMKARSAQAAKSMTLSEQARAKAEPALKTAAALPDSWNILTFDETKEVSIIAADLAENRQYKVDNYRDPAAAKVAKDIKSADAVLLKAEKGLQAARNDILAYNTTYLPAGQASALVKEQSANAKAVKKVKKAREALRELKNDNYIWGHISVAAKSDGDLMAALGRADAALKAGDYVALQEATAAAKTAMADSIDWLQVGELELTNVGVYSKDTYELKSFISRAKDAVSAYEQSAIFLFGNRADAGAFKQATVRAEGLMANLSQQAEAQQFGRGYKAWFVAAANRRL